MAQVFLSYKSEDREHLRPLVSALEATGISVWWDARIQGGTAWRERIQEELGAAELIIVVWSEGSIGPGGRFVRDEASFALERGAYLPLLIDQVRLPIGFGEVQALSLVGWKGAAVDPRLRAVVQTVQDRLSACAVAIRPEPRPGVRPSTLSRRTALTGAALAVVGAGSALYWRFNAPGARRSTGIAVLPFANLSDDPSQVYFSAGLAEELRDALRRIESLKVIGRDSCETVKSLPAHEVAEKLAVAHVLTGSVRRSATHLKVSSQLIEGASGAELWSQSYDRAPGDAIEVQTGIAESIVQALRIRLAPGEKAALEAGGTNSAEAQDLYLQAQARLRKDDSEPELRKTLSLAEAAIALDSGYFEASWLRSTVLSDIASYARSLKDREGLLDESEAETRRAISLAPQLARGYSSLAYTLALRLRFVEAQQLFRRALQTSREDRITLQGYGRFLASTGRGDEGTRLAAGAIKFDPLNPYVYSDYGETLFFNRQYTIAVENYQHALRIAPNSIYAHQRLGDCFAMMGEARSARAEYDAADKGPSTGRALLAAKAGDRISALAELDSLVAKYTDAVTYDSAQVRAQLGELDDAMAALIRCKEAKDANLLQLAADPWLDPVRNDSRFKELIVELKFPELQGLPVL